MNFLSHFYFELPNTNPYFVAGLAVPDLTIHFSKRYNQIIKGADIPAANDLAEIHRGILAHYAADKKFHNSPLFLNQVSVLIQECLKQGLDRRRWRLSVLSHLAVEMMLDRQIYHHQKEICSQYYSVLQLADMERIEYYFDHMGIALEKQDFIPKFQLYIEKRFLERFDDLESIVWGLGKIYSFVTKTLFTDLENKQLLAALSNIDEEMRYRWQDFLKV
ncbi:MAG: hypothetical protein IPH78_11315 [Bacteroidetes bacterium]|nr:hypothetical protein [Bacteroidota bacterium]MBK8658976.1 hypothetical protein [Bacteroidota bacterium]